MDRKLCYNGFARGEQTKVISPPISVEVAYTVPRKHCSYNTDLLDFTEYNEIIFD